MIPAIQAPEGTVTEFALLFLVILSGPTIVERAKVPGIIGLLVGGYAIGPHGIGWIDAGNQTIPDLGQLGLLYLMFVAGLELDLRLLSAYRRAAVSFGVMTFAIPFVAGTAVGSFQGWEIGSSLLLGSLIASHTLIIYPTIRDAGRATNPAVATAVGATVLTDTLALVVLAGVSGTATGSGSTVAVLGEVAAGVVILAVTALLVLPKVVSAALNVWGGDRAARYLVAIVAFLAMAMLAEVFSIEGIVGAFFAGIALNRLVPNEGPSMERIEFFGSAVLVPAFLVSVGLLLDPAVMFTTETLGLAVLIIAACLGGKALAAIAARPFLHFSWAEVGVMFVLTTPQAAATLAATIVGHEIGLFGTTVVNAVLVLILVSILASTLLAGGFASKVAAATARPAELGEQVLLAAGPGGPTEQAMRLAKTFAEADAGLVDVLLAHREDERPLSPTEIKKLESKYFNSAVDGTIRAVVDRDVPAAVVHAGLSDPPSVVIVDESTDPATGGWETLDLLLGHTPGVVVVRGGYAALDAIHPDDERLSSAVVKAMTQAAARTSAAAPGATTTTPTVTAGAELVVVGTWSEVGTSLDSNPQLRLVIVDPSNG